MKYTRIRQGVLLLVFVSLTLLVTPTHGLKRVNGTCPGANVKCKKGIALPVWEPQDSLSPGDKAARAIVYFVSLVYMFLGVSIIADRFMAAIEVITSHEKSVTIKRPNGEKTVVSVRVWNETVSNLTLMALGSSAPEIMLSVIEICGNRFFAGDLGPGTIVGSAAFNMFVIIGLCVMVIPDNEIRIQNHLRVFFITCSWSIFAYIWMYLIIAKISPGEVEIWEGIVTLLCFPLTVLTAYMADKRIIPGRKLLPTKYRGGRGPKTVVMTEGGEMELGKTDGQIVPSHLMRSMSVKETKEFTEFEQHRKEYINVLRELRKKNPDADMEALQHMANYEIMNRGPKSRAFYRIQATRKLTGGGNVLSKKKIDELFQQDKLTDVKGGDQDPNCTLVYFDPAHYTVFENVGTFDITVIREGGNDENTIYVDYKTEDGTANSKTDYEHTEGTLVFNQGQKKKTITIKIIDDDIFEEDEHFYMNLSNVRVGGPDGMFISNGTAPPNPIAKLATPFVATVMILDDDHHGIFTFDSGEHSCHESDGETKIRLGRHSGARGKVKVAFHTTDGTAKKGRDFILMSNEIFFENDQTEAFIHIQIIDDEEYEKDEVFYLELEDPHVVEGSESGDSGAEVEKSEKEMTEEEKIAQMGKPKLGDVTRVAIRIKESMEFKTTVDSLIKSGNVASLLGTSSWKQQFKEAVSVNPADDDDEEGEEGEEGEEKQPSCFDYVMHFLTLPWKVFFAFVPPTDYWGGWLCFTVSIIMIGLLTAIIGDLASHFGCTIGLRDSVTAISFVALGTSIPDTFASKVAAVQDQYADSSIGNVTGSNAVNVFLGIGIAWSLAAIYHAVVQTKGGFQVDPGSLAFSVTIFCVFAVICTILLLIRRLKIVGGELGGPRRFKIPTSLIFFSLWILYVLLSSFESYCYIEGY